MKMKFCAEWSHNDSVAEYDLVCAQGFNEMVIGEKEVTQLAWRIQQALLEAGVFFSESRFSPDERMKLIAAEIRKS